MLTLKQKVNHQFELLAVGKTRRYLSILSGFPPANTMPCVPTESPDCEASDACKTLGKFIAE